jgi:hypothetical protein
MMLLQQDMNTEGDEQEVKEMVAALKAWHQVNPFATGINWAAQVYWAKMTEENFMLFAILHPSIALKFKKV